MHQLRHAVYFLYFFFHFFFSCRYINYGNDSVLQLQLLLIINIIIINHQLLPHYYYFFSFFFIPGYRSSISIRPPPPLSRSRPSTTALPLPRVFTVHSRARAYLASSIHLINKYSPLPMRVVRDSLQSHSLRVFYFSIFFFYIFIIFFLLFSIN